MASSEHTGRSDLNNQDEYSSVNDKELPIRPRLSISNPSPVAIDGPSLLHELVAKSHDGLSLDFTQHDGKRISLSYVELHDRSTRLANMLACSMALAEKSSQPIIPLLIPQSPELYLGMLGVLKAGCAFCPLPLDAPTERLNFIIQDVSASLVLTVSSLQKQRTSFNGVDVLYVDQPVDADSDGERMPLHEAKPADTAYVMYTSGSTGKPKGVLVSHRAATQSLLAHDKHIPSYSRFLQFAAPTFDVSMFEIFFTFYRGATLVACDRTDLLSDLSGTMRRLNVDAAELTPTVAGGLLKRRDVAPNLSLLLTIGEMLTPSVVEEFGGNSTKDSLLWAMYGPTEAAIHCTLQPAFATHFKVGNIGFPLDTVSAFIVSAQAGDSTSTDVEVLPIGQVGELAVGGHQLADGYLNRPEQTNKAFIDSEQHGRLYLTGDKARMLPNGTLECLGRIATGQVKLRGQRVELGEVEAAALRVPGCRVAVACVIHNNLILFGQVDDDSISPDTVVTACRQWLPSFMVPSDVLLFKQLPQLASGKVDRKELERRYEAETRQAPSESPQVVDEITSKVCEVFSGLVGRPIQPGDNLAAVGLDSLLAIQAVGRFRENGITLSTIDILASSTPVQLRSFLSTIESAQRTAVKQENISGDVEPSLKEEVLGEIKWPVADIEDVLKCTPLQISMLAETAKDPRMYWNWVEIEFRKSCSFDDVRGWLMELCTQNEMLRSGFYELGHTDSPYVQIVWSSLKDDQFSQVDCFSRSFETSSGISLGWPIHFQICCGNSTTKVLVLLHHALYDGWSLDLFTRDLALLSSGSALPSRPQFRQIAKYYADLDNKDSKTFWQEQLADFNPTPMPQFYAKAPQLREQASVSRTLSTNVSDLRQSALKLGVSQQSFIQAAIAYLMNSYLGNSDIAIATVTSGRTLPVMDIENIIGPCISTLPLRVNVGHSRRVRDLVHVAYERTRGMLPHCTLPYRDIKRAGGIDASVSLSDVLFIWQESLPSRFASTESQRVKIVGQSDQLEFKLLLEVEPQENCLRSKATFQQDTFLESQIELLLRQIDGVVHLFVSDTDMELNSVGERLPSDLLSISNPRPEVDHAVHPVDAPADLSSICAVKPDVNEEDSPISLRHQTPNTLVLVCRPGTRVPVLRGGLGEMCLGGVAFEEEFKEPGTMNQSVVSLTKYGELQRTGDLGRLLPDDSILLVGRIDEQVEVRGQRIDMGEVNRALLSQYSIQDCFTLQVLALEASPAKLVSFVVPKGGHGQPLSAVALDSSLLAILRDLLDALSRQIPAYMIPSQVVPVTHLPKTTQEKVDQVALLNCYQNLSSDYLNELSHGTEVRIATEAWSPIESKLVDFVASTLKVSTRNINKNTSLFALGLDSITAIPLSKLVRSHLQHSFSVSTILENPTISRLAARMASAAEADGLPEPDLARAFNAETVERIKATLQPRLDKLAFQPSIEDVLPCTALQEALVASTYSSNSTSYCNVMQWKIKGDLEKLRRSWKAMIQRHPILRTCFVPTEQPELPVAQVVLSKHQVTWCQASIPTDQCLRTNVEEMMGRVKEALTSLRPPYLLNMYSSEGCASLLLVCHHALYDAAAMGILLRDIELHYDGNALPDPVPFRPYLETAIAMRSESMVQFWCDKLGGYQPALLKAPSSVKNLPVPYKFDMPLASVEAASKAQQCTLKSLLQSAWVKVLHSIFSTQDLCFGNIVSGRTIDVEDVDKLVAPTFNTIPIRVDLGNYSTNASLLRTLEHYNGEALKYQLVPLRSIQQRLGHSWGLFSTLFLLQQAGYDLDPRIWTLVRDDGYMGFPLVIELIPHRESNSLETIIHSELPSSESCAVDIGNAFKSALHSCIMYPESDVHDFDTLSAACRAHLEQFVIKPNSTSANDESSVGSVSNELRHILSPYIKSSAKDLTPSTTIYQLGLDSISAIQLTARLRAEKNICVSAAYVLEKPRLSDLDALIQRAAGDQSETVLKFDFNQYRLENEDAISNHLAISVIDIESIVPCTPLQQGLIAQSTHNRGRYINGITYKLGSQQDTSLLSTVKDAWNRVVHRHSILRSTFIPTDNPILPFAMATLQTVDINHLVNEWSNLGNLEYSVKRFVQDFMEQRTLLPWEVRLSLSTQGAFMQFIFHHALFDAHSLRTVLRDLDNEINNQRLLTPAAPVEGVINNILVAALPESIGQIESASSPSAVFWRNQLKEMPTSRFPCMSPLRSEKKGPVCLMTHLSISTPVLDAACQEIGITMQAAGQAAWAMLLAAYTGESHVIFGTVLSGRDVHPDADDVVFPTIVTVPTAVKTDEGIPALLSSLITFNAAVRRHQFAPMSKIQRWTDRSNDPLFDTLFAFQKSDQVELPFTLEEQYSTAEYAVSMELETGPDRMLTRLSFEVDVLPPQQAQIMLKQYDAILCGLARNHQATFEPNQINPSLLSILPAKVTSLPSPVALLHQFVEYSAQLYPKRVALQFASTISPEVVNNKWAYQELDENGNRIANLLSSLKVSQGDLVGICFDKCPEASFAMLGILKAGCAFVAIDPSAPWDRKEFILNDSRAVLVLTSNGSFCSAWRMGDMTEKGIGIKVVDLSNEDWKEVSGQPPSLAEPIRPEDTCYCLYTSGTTGTPKGCLITHDNAVQAMRAFSHIFAGRWSTESKWLQFASFHFDVSVLEQYWSWSEAICVVSAPRDILLQDLPGAIRALKVTHIDLTPSLATILRPEEVPTLNQGVFITGGEKLKQGSIDSWGETRVIHNGYGPTEATIGVTMYPGVPSTGHPNNIGYAFENVGAYVLQPMSETPVLRGAVGELCVAGKLVGRGYLNRPDLTEQKFPLLSALHERVYRTGDLVRVLHDGSFEFIGRADDQVKLRGQRLELGEINSVIRKGVPAVTEVATLLLKHARLQKEQLVAFLAEGQFRKHTDPLITKALVNSKSQTVIEAAKACRLALPTYMIPSHYVPVSYLPLTSNNKIDVNKLQQSYDKLDLHQLQSLSGKDASRTLTGSERKVAEALCQFVGLEVADISSNSNVLELGLDSVSAIPFSKTLKACGFASANAQRILNRPIIQLIAELSKASQPDTAEDDLAISKAKSAIALYGRSQESEVLQILKKKIDEIQSILPPTALQAGMISRSLSAQHGVYYNSFRLQLDERVDILKLKRAWTELSNLLPILRTVFVRTEDGHAQVVLQEPFPFWFEKSDASDSSLALFRNQWIMANQVEIVAPFRVLLARFASGDRVLMLYLFHALYDGNSIPLLLHQLYCHYHGIQKHDFVPAFADMLPYGPFRNNAGAREFWETQLPAKGVVSSLSFKKPDTVGERVFASLRFPCYQQFDAVRRQLRVTHQALIQACWLLTLRRYATGPVTIGLVVSGRNLDIDGADRVIGPIFNTIPFHFVFQDNEDFGATVLRCHDFNVKALPFQHTPLRHIRAWLSAPPQQALFDSILVFQKRTNVMESAVSNELWKLKPEDSVPDYPLALEVDYGDDGILEMELAAQGDSMDEATAHSVLKQFRTILDDAITKTNFTPDPSPPKDTSSSTTPGIRDTPSTMHPEAMEGGIPAPLQNYKWSAKANRIRTEISKLARISANKITASSSIFEFGLDSIDAVKLASRLEKSGYYLTVSQIMRHPTVEQLVNEASNSPHPQMSSTNDLSQIETRLKKQLVHQGMDLEKVERVLPCTPLQESMLVAMVDSKFKEYFNHDVLQLEEDVDIIRLRGAWQKVFDLVPVLRTAFVTMEDSTFSFAQVIYSTTALPWTEVDAHGDDDLPEILDSITECAAAAPMETPKFRLKLVRLRTYELPLLILSLPHAMYDGASIQLLHQAVARCYRGDTGSIEDIARSAQADSSLKAVINAEAEESKTFWSDYLAGADSTILSNIEKIDQTAQNRTHLKERTSQISSQAIHAAMKDANLPITLQAVGQLCWSIVLASLVSKPEVLFGVVLSGRDTTESLKLLFPIMNTVIFRSNTIQGSYGQMLREMQENINTVREHQRFPLRKVQQSGRKLFNTLFIYQKTPEMDVSADSLYQSAEARARVDIPLCVELEEVEGNLTWRVACTAKIFNAEETERLLLDLETVLREIVTEPENDARGFIERVEQRTNSERSSTVGRPASRTRSQTAGQPSGWVAEQALRANTWTSSHNQRPPRSGNFDKVERAIRSALSQVAGIPESEIDPIWTIFDLGLDSISAIRVTTMLQKQSISLSVSQMMRETPTITRMAEIADAMTQQENVLSTSTTTHNLWYLDCRTFAHQLQVDPAVIECVLPATAGQIYVLHQWGQSNGALFKSEFKFDVFGGVSEADLKYAWEQVARANPILRSRFVFTDSPTAPVVQVVLNSSEGISQAFVLPVQSENENSWTVTLHIHHALYDALSLSQLIRQFEQFLRGPALAPDPSEYESFKHLVRKAYNPSATEQAEMFWSRYFAGREDFPEIISTKGPVFADVRRYQPGIDGAVTKLPEAARYYGVGVPQLFMAAWAKVFKKHLSKQGANDADVIIGVYMANRAFAIDGLATVAAPTFNIVPVRVRSPGVTDIIDVAKQIQSDLLEISALENSMTALSSIADWTGLFVETVVNFVPSLPVQPDGQSGAQSAIRVVEAIEHNTPERYTRPRDPQAAQTFKQGQGWDKDLMRGLEHVSPVTKMAYSEHCINVEGAIRNGRLDVGVFAPDTVLKDDKVASGVLGSLMRRIQEIVHNWDKEIL